MTVHLVSMIPIQYVLASSSEALFALSERLQRIESILFDQGPQGASKDHLQEMQDIDLIIQQLADIARVVAYGSEADLCDATIDAGRASAEIRLKDMRVQLLGVLEEGKRGMSPPDNDVLLF